MKDATYGRGLFAGDHGFEAGAIITRYDGNKHSVNGEPRARPAHCSAQPSVRHSVSSLSTALRRSLRCRACHQPAACHLPAVAAARIRGPRM